MALYKSRQYEKALPLLKKLAIIHSESHFKFVLEDMYYRYLAKDLDYEIHCVRPLCIGTGFGDLCIYHFFYK